MFESISGSMKLFTSIIKGGGGRAFNDKTTDRLDVYA